MPIHRPVGMRVVVAAADPLAREAVAARLSAQPGIVVAGTTGADANLATELERLSPDAVILDLGLGPEPDMAPLRGLAAEGPPVIALAAGERDARDAIGAGVAAAEASFAGEG